MAVNRFYKRTPYDIGLYTPPIDYLEENLKIAQQQYEVGQTVAEQIKNHYIDSLPQDRAKANELQHKWEKKIDDVVSQYNGNYALAGKDLRGLLSEIQKEYNPGGQAFAIKSNLDKYTQWLTTQQERVKSGKVLAEDLNLAHDYYMKGYTGIGDIDPVTGTYNRFDPDEISDYVDPESIIQDVYKGFKPEKYKVGRTVFENGLQKYTEVEQEGISANRLAPSFAQALQNNPKYIQNIEQRAKWLGLSSEDVGAWNMQYVQQRAQDLSYMNTSDIQKAERDPLMLVREKARLAKKNQDEFLGAMQWQWDATTNNPIAPELKVNGSNWRDFNYSGVIDNVSFSSTYLGIPSNAPASTKGSKFKGDLGSVLKDPSFISKSGIIPQLAEQVYKDVSTEYKGRSSKEIEQRFWETYEKSHTNATAGQSMTQNIPNKARKVMTEELLPGILANSFSMYKVGDPVVSSPQSLGIDSKALTNEDGKLKVGVQIRAYARPGIGTAKAGYILSIPDKGDYVVVDPNFKRQEASMIMEQALGPIFTSGKTVGNPMPIGTIDNKMVLGTPKWEFTKRSDGTYKGDIYFYDPATDRKIIKPDKQPFTYLDMQEKYDGNFLEALPHGASPSDNAYFDFYYSRMLNEQE